jgi:hypothetical protein
MIPLIAALLVFAGFQDPQAGTGAIEGIVTRAGSSQPIQGARVAIWGDKGPDFQTTTDANGHYAFGGIPTGPFNMEVQAEGYLSTPDPSTGKTIRFTISDGQLTRHDVTMTSAGALAGRVLDENREPLPGVAVEVLQLRLNSWGRPTWNPVAQVVTNDRGEYRVESLPPDEYYVRASRRRASGPPDSGSIVDLAATYFPGTADARSAAPVQVRESAEVSAEFALASVRAYSVTGRISLPDSPQPAPPVQLYVIPQDSKTPLDPQVNAGIPVKVSSEGTGTFQIRGLLPGGYDLFGVALPLVYGTATPSGENGTAVVRFASTTRVPGRLGTIPFQIRDEDERDVLLSLDPGVEIKGRVTAANSARIPQLSVSLHSRQEFLATLLSIQASVEQNNESNSFTLAGVPAGKYDVEVHGIGNSDSLYLADVRANARSVMEEGLDVFARPMDSLEIVLGFDGGVIEGTINAVQDSPVLVVLAPQAPRRQNGSLFKTRIVENPISEGFRFTAVAPGSYSVFAFEIPAPTNTVPYRNPDFLSLHETQGIPVIVEKAAATGPVRLPPIPQ